MIYLDNAATSYPKPEVVYQAVDCFMRYIGASPGRSGHRLAIEAGRLVYETREMLAELFGVENPLQIIFTLNATEALNLVINGVLSAGDHVITSVMEHNAVMRPLQAVKEREIELTIAKCSPEGVLFPQEVARVIRPNTQLIILNHASNVTGIIQPIAKISEIARDHKILLAVDAAQTAGCYPINVKALGVDFLAFSGHKGLYGPPGTGGLFIREGREAKLKPLVYGGTGSYSEFTRQPDFLPDKYESGTPNTAGLAGLKAGVRFVLDRGISQIYKHEDTLGEILRAGLWNIKGVKVYSSDQLTPQPQLSVVSFNIAGFTPSEVAVQLEEKYQIMCRPGLHCAPLAHQTIGTFPQGTVRLSPGYFNTLDEIKTVVKAIEEIASQATYSEQRLSRPGG